MMTHHLEAGRLQLRIKNKQSQHGCFAGTLPSKTQSESEVLGASWRPQTADEGCSPTICM